MKNILKIGIFASLLAIWQPGHTVLTLQKAPVQGIDKKQESELGSLILAEMKRVKPKDLHEVAVDHATLTLGWKYEQSTGMPDVTNVQKLFFDEVREVVFRSSVKLMEPIKMDKDEQPWAFVEISTAQDSTHSKVWDSFSDGSPSRENPMSTLKLHIPYADGRRVEDLIVAICRRKGLTAKTSVSEGKGFYWRTTTLKKATSSSLP